MNKLMLIFLIFSNALFAQNDESFITDFLLEDKLNFKNETDSSTLSHLLF